MQGLIDQHCCEKTSQGLIYCIDRSVAHYFASRVCAEVTCCVHVSVCPNETSIALDRTTRTSAAADPPSTGFSHFATGLALHTHSHLQEWTPTVRQFTPRTPLDLSTRMYLIDSGFTDVTCTVYLGRREPSQQENESLTRALWAHIAPAHGVPPRTWTRWWDLTTASRHRTRFGRLPQWARGPLRHLIPRHWVCGAHVSVK